MKKFYPLLALVVINLSVSAQSTWEGVYTIFQTNCATPYCHGSASASAGLDLEGVGATTADKMADVYAHLYQQGVANSAASSKNNQLIYPGDPYRSFIFRKINNYLSPDVPLHNNEGDIMPLGGAGMDKREIELVRQWILFGAPEAGIVADTVLIDRYYDEGGNYGLISNPPLPPANGFQIHVGPFFLPPSTAGNPPEEVEYFSKYETLLNSSIEINEVETFMGDFSHHMIIYKFWDGMGDNYDHGLRDDLDFNEKDLVTAEQFSNSLRLPGGTAFQWQANSVLDLNPHYINYSNDFVAGCEVYLNIHTQAYGTANQVMHSELIANPFINIPNDNQPHTFTQDVYDSSLLIDLWVWGLGSHTHQYGTDFDIYHREGPGQKGEQIYDGACPDGLPGCSNQYYDYQHPPILYKLPFEKMNLAEGFIAEATYQNDGPNPVSWGFTSDDEMMVFTFFYTFDTSGIDFPADTSSGPEDSSTFIGSSYTEAQLGIFPNPLSLNSDLMIAGSVSEQLKVELFDVTGRLITANAIIRPLSTTKYAVQFIGDIRMGLHLVRVSDRGKVLKQERILIQE